MSIPVGIDNFIGVINVEILNQNFKALNLKEELIKKNI